MNRRILDETCVEIEKDSKELHELLKGIVDGGTERLTFEEITPIQNAIDNAENYLARADAQLSQLRQKANKS